MKTEKMIPLCAYCSKVPLEPELKRLTSKNYGPDDLPTWSLGTFGQARLRDCPFCELVVSICAKPVASNFPLEPPDDSEEIEVRWHNGGFDTPGHSPRGSYVCLTGKGHREFLYRARDSFERWINLEDVHRWISTCEREHSPDCCPKLSTSDPRSESGQRLSFRVIDVDAMCIVDAPQPCKYVALSYTWGKSNEGRLFLKRSNKAALMQPGSLSKARASIPDSIADSMLVVHRLQERFLWVDSLCLLQDDANELQESIAVMDTFYQMAILTIVAATGSDAYSGLPGVFPTPRKASQLVREVVSGLQMTTITDMDTWLRRSHYSTRAWTMQEEMLSNRLLVFIHGQVYFRCKRNLYSESMNAPGQPLVGFDKSASMYSMALINSNFLDFSTVMMYYGARSLSFQSDALRAAQGMLRRFSTLSGTKLFEGLPVPLDRSLLFFKGDLSPKHLNSRRENFPSYSWTGWKISPRWSNEVESSSMLPDNASENDTYKTRHVLRTWILWHCILNDSSVYSIDDSAILRQSFRLSAEKSRARSSQEFQRIPIPISDFDLSAIRESLPSFPLLCFWTVCVDLRLIKMQRPDGTYRPDALEAVDNNGQRVGIVQMDTSSYEARNVGRFALLAAEKDSFWALLLKLGENGIAERRGIVKLTRGFLDNCLPPGPRWKEIVLG